MTHNFSNGKARNLALIAPWGIICITVALALTERLTVAVGICAALIAVLLLWNWRLRLDIGRLLRSHAMMPGAEPTEALAEQGADIADLHHRLARVDHRLVATHPLSGLPMREPLLARIELDADGLLGAIAFIDFDRLTAFDPALGERVFSILAARLRRMVPECRFLAHVDRGQVCIWFGNQVDIVAAQAELEALAYALSDTILTDGREIEPQIQCRIAMFDRRDDLTATGFLSRLLASFSLPGGMVLANEVKIDPADLARDRYDLEQDLRQAIARRELVLEFQPLIDARARRVCGAEALLRWHHPTRGPVSPARFVPVMESGGLAGGIGMWVLNAAVREAGTWRDCGFSDLRMAVNVSGLQLDGDDLPILIDRTLKRHALGANCLEIELTESIATSDVAHCRRIFEQLRAMGVTLAVDDFGTGFSGFSSLRALKFDKIKIDREFVTAVDTRRDSQAICQSIVALGRGLGIRVLAEGVERHAEYAWLRRHGCDHFQGYYFSRPLDADRFASFVRDTRGLESLLSLGEERRDTIERLSA